MTDSPNATFSETIVLMDQNSWVWKFVNTELLRLSHQFVKIPANTVLRHSWYRFCNSKFFIIDWESPSRSGGAIVEEIANISPEFKIEDRIIVLTTNPNKEDVIYFSELGIKKVIKLKNRFKEMEDARREFKKYILGSFHADPEERTWYGLLKKVDQAMRDCEPRDIEDIESRLFKLTKHSDTARYLDVEGSLSFLRGDYEFAMNHWHKALERNPNYFRVYHNLITCYRHLDRNEQALELMRKLHSLNKQSIARLVGMCEIQLAMNDYDKAETFFNGALEKDPYCSGALNGLAEISFYTGDLSKCRGLLSRSNESYKIASRLNIQGINLVKDKKFKQALDHYTRAQYVLPQFEKGPMLFYNIALCYTKWDNISMAMEFAKIALIKNPDYTKAQDLIQKLGKIEASRARKSA